MGLHIFFAKNVYACLFIKEYVAAVLFNPCARCILGCTKMCVRCTTKKGFTKVHHKHGRIQGGRFGRSAP